MKTRPAFLVVALLGLATVIGLAIAWQRPFLGRQTLADGTVLTLVRVGAGSKHPAPSATLLQRLAAPLPPSWRAWLKVWPPPATSSSVSSNYLSVWLAAEGKAGGQDPPWRVLVGDDRENFSLNERSYSRHASVQLRSNLWLYGLPVVAWPRRAETLRIQVCPADGDKAVAEFRVKNPGRDLTTPPWTASAWPLTVRDGDYEFTLTGLWLGLGWDQVNWTLWTSKNPLSRCTRATFRVLQRGEVQTNWNAFNVRTIRDATGNWSQGDGYRSLCRAGETMNQFSTPPPPADEAWRMTVEFSRISGFGAEELHTVAGFPLPQAGQPQPAPFVSQSNQVRLEVRWEISPLDPSPYRIWARVTPETSDYRLTLVRAVDNQGRLVPAEHHGHGTGSVGEILKPSPDATSVDLVFAYHRSKLITFQVKPEFYRPPAR